MPIEYMFCFICIKQCIKIISLRKKSGFLVLHLGKLILSLIFKECVG